MPPPTLNKDCIATIFKYISETSQKPAKSSIFDSFNNYLALETKPMSNAAQFWINFCYSSFPFSNIALKILSVLASSATVERLFSLANRIMSSLRTRLSAQRLETLLLISMNS